MKKVIFLVLLSVLVCSLMGSRVNRENNKGTELFLDSLYTEAEEHFKVALEEDEFNPIVNYNYGLNLLKKYQDFKSRDDLKQAIDYMSKAKQDTVKSLDYLASYNLGNLYYFNEEYDKALEEYSSAASLLDSTAVDLDLVYNTANTIYKLTEKESSKDSLLTLVASMYNSIIEDVPDNEKANILHNLGNVCMQKQDFQGAVQQYSKALLSNPYDDETRYNYEIALRKLKEQEQQNQQKQDQKQQDKKQDKKEQKQDKQNQQNQKEQQKKESERKQDEYKQMNKKEKQKLDAEKKLNALIQQQSQDKKDKDKKPVIKVPPSGRFW